MTPPRPTIARGPALVVGAGILGIAVLAGLVGAGGPTGLLTGSDAGATLRDSLASPEVYRFSVAALVLVALLDVVVAWGVFQLFAPVNPALARLAAWSRLAYAGVFLVAISQLVGDPDIRGFTEFNDVWQVSLVLFGGHLVALGVLGHLTRLVPGLINLLLVVAGVGYLVDSFGYLLVDDYSAAVGAFTFLGELLLGLWLVATAARRTSRTHPATPARVTEQVPAPSSR
ncbi:MAG: DUF4386 domain-containing protein [Marmoricola sp.]